MQCEICKREFKNLLGISKHLVNHNITSEDYFLTYIDNKKGTCNFCGKETKFKNLIKGYQKYCNSYCCNNDIGKRQLVSSMKSIWWETSPKVEATKNKIKKTIVDIWHDDTSNYNTKDYRKKLSTAKATKWKQWRDEELNSLVKSYGFELISPYQHAHQVCTFKCYKCGKEFETMWNYIQSGKACPHCFTYGISNAENELFDYIKSLLPQDTEIIRNSMKVIYPKELDIFIPEKNIAFEYNGLWTHSANCVWGNKDKTYHLNKTNDCREQNIDLIHIFEDEWIFKKDVVKSRIAYILGHHTGKKIFARKCSIKEISSKEKNLFLNNHHLQGQDAANIKLGAYYEDELIAVMTFSKGKISKGSKPEDGVWELSRFCSNNKYLVIGIASKLLTYFKSNYKWKKIFSYADRRWSTGRVYYKLGFNLEHITKPNYWYIKNYRRVHRFSLRKKGDEPKTISEFNLRLSQGYDWIWDCGNLKFFLDNENNGG